MPWLRTVSIDDPVQRLAALARAPERQPGGAAGPGAGRAGGRAARPGRRRGRALLADDPWEWRAVWMSGWSPWPAATSRGAERVQRGLRPGARRAGAQAGAGVRLRARRRRRRRRVALRRLRPHRRQLHRTGRVRPGPDPRRPRGLPGAVARAGPGAARPAGRSPRRAAAGPAARRVGRRAAVAGRGPGQHRERSPSTRSTGPASGSRCSSAALDGRGVARRRTTRRASPGAARPSPPCATGSRRRTAIWPARLDDRRSGSTWSTGPTRCDDGRCDDRAEGGRRDPRRRGRPACQASVAAGDAFCESCGASSSPPRAVDRGPATPTSAARRSSWRPRRPDAPRVP